MVFLNGILCGNPIYKTDSCGILIARIYVVSPNGNHLAFFIRITEDYEIVLINIIKPLKSGYRKTVNVIYASGFFDFAEH